MTENMTWPLEVAEKGQNAIDLGGIDKTLNYRHRRDLAGELQGCRARAGVIALA